MEVALAIIAGVLGLALGYTVDSRNHWKEMSKKLAVFYTESMKALLAIILAVFSGTLLAGDYLYAIIDTADDGEIELTHLHGCTSNGRGMQWVISPGHGVDDLLCYEITDGSVILHHRKGGEYRRFKESDIKYQWRSEPCFKCNAADEEEGA